MRLVFAALLGLLSPAASLAGDPADINAKLASRVKDPELRDMTERMLREMNTDYSGVADIGLLKKGEKFDHARLEITGVMSSDPTEKIEPGLFDQFVKPSFSNGEKLGFFAGFIEDFKHLMNPALDLSLDIKDYQQAAAGVMTKRATKVLAAYEKKEINEIVAHSWGCELIYAAILNGKMNPPKKLIVVGVPDDDFAKWEELALRTGTAVVWVRAKNDKVAKEGSELVKGTAGDIKAKWDADCARTTEPKICARRPPSVAAKIQPARIPGLDGHGRKEYYKFLKEYKFLRGGFEDLRAAERAVKAAEVKEVQRAAFEGALAAARVLVARAHEQANIARLENDEWLKNAWIDIARRSCANPGSVTQAELDGLPKSNETSLMDTMPRGLGECAGTAYSMLKYGATAEQLRAASTPKVPTNPQPSQQAPIRMNPGAPGFPSGFNPAGVLPDLSRFAITACRAPDQAQIVHLYSPDYNFAYKEFDDKVARSLASGLDGCARKIFYQLIEMIRAREYWNVDGQWIRTTVASYKSGSASSPDYAAPPGGDGTPPSEDDGCGTDPNGVRWCWK